MVTMAEGGKKLLEALKGTGVETEEDLATYMLDYLKLVGKVPYKGKESEQTDTDKHDGNPKAQGKGEAHEYTGGYRQPPKLSNFSGDPSAKGEVSFDHWRWEVDCHVHDALYSSDAIRQAIRKSLKGNAGGIAKRLGADASIKEILGKLDTVYGTVESGESLLAEFYAATQDKKEDVAAWSCRLEDLLEKAEEASQQSPRSPEEREMILRSRFWMGLQQQLKDSSRHKYDTIQNYDKLRVEIRQIEHEHRLRDNQGKDTKGSGQAQVKMSAAAAASSTDAAAAAEQDSFKRLEAMVQKLSHQVNNMQNDFKDLKQKQSGNEGKQDSTSQQTWGNKGPSEQKENTSKGRTSQGKGGGGQTQGSGKTHEPFTCYKCGGHGHMKRDCPSKSVPTCWDCKEVGHTKYNCPHSLNEEKPLSGGRQ